MFIFIRWLLAHLIGDFPLQTNKIHTLKFKGLKSGIPHILLVLCCLIILSWPYLYLPSVWLFFLFIGITHLFQDWAKIKLSKTSKHNLLFYILDQALHVIFISVAFLPSFKYLHPPQPTTNIIALYNNDKFLLLLILVLLVSYNGHYMIIFFKKDYLNATNPYSTFEKWHGMIERTIIVSLFLLGGPWFMAIPVILYLRLLFFYLGKNKLSVSKQFVSVTEITLSGIVGAVIGIIAYAVI